MLDQGQILHQLTAYDPKIYAAFDIKNNKFIYTNPAFEQFFKVNTQDANLEHLLDKIHEDDKAYVMEVYDHLMPGVFEQNIEFRLVFGDDTFCFRANLLMQETEEDGLVLSGYMEDISGLKKNMSTLLALSNKKNAVLNILSHDLAGPLGSIQNYSYLLSNQTDPKDELTLKMIGSIDLISKRCIKLIQEFIKMEFLESVGVEMVKARYNLVDIVGSFMKEYLLQQHALKKNVVFEYDQELVFAEVDDTKLMQVINNLLSNALKFTPDGGEIKVVVTKVGDYARMVVKDTGIGIPKEFHATLFDKFGNARRKGVKGEDSVGLGMNITKTIVDWHHGKIWFESEEGKGTVFFIDIPACD